MSILSKLHKVKEVSAENARVPMTEAEIEKLRDRLRKSNKINVTPNRFDNKVPYQVSINFNNKWNNFGAFKNINAASAIGSLVSLAFFGDRAKKGTYDEAKAEASTEFQEWLADPRNEQVIAHINNGTSVLGESTQTEANTAAKDFDEDQPF